MNIACVHMYMHTNVLSECIFCMHRTQVYIYIEDIHILLKYRIQVYNIEDIACFSCL